MRLADFIDSCMEEILGEWEAFAATQLPSAATVDAFALRDHAPQILRAIADDLRQPQTAAAQSAKSHGLAAGGPSAAQTAAEVHGTLRARAGFSITQLLSEYRALRASVLRLWMKLDRSVSISTAADDVMRFNEAIDQAIAESADFFNQEFTDDRIAREAMDRELMRNRGRLEYASRLSNVGFWYCDLPFDVLEWDDRVKEHFFIEPSARVTIEDFYDRIHPEDRERTRSAIAASISSRDAYDIVYRTRHPSSGEIKWIRALGGTDYTSDGSPIHFDGITVDVTAQKLDEKRVAESEARHRGVITNMDEAFSLFDRDFNIIEVNDAACQLVGIARPQFIGCSHWQLFPGTYESELGQMYRQVLLDGQPRFLEHLYVYPDGRAVWYEVRAFKVGDGVAALFRDVTDRVEMIEALKSADRRKDEFLAMLAHELRNPLAPISTAAELLKIASGNQDKVRHASNIISRQVSHMVDLVDDLLDVSRVTRGLVELQKEALDLKSVVDGAVEQTRPLFEARHHVLTTRMASAHISVHGDRTRLTQVISNLLSNAAKYTQQGGEITLNVTVEHGDAKIEVKDNGIGIEQKLLPHVFELFTQAERTPDRSQGGLGIGLALVKSIVELHEGKVGASSNGPGMGSAFTVSLPIVTSAAESVPIHGALSSSPAVKPLKIMVVDDNVDAAYTLCALLETEGHQVMMNENARSALESVERVLPNVFVLDIGLPDMTGYELAIRLRQNPHLANSTFIALSGYGQAHDRVLSKGAGFQHHLVKPVDMMQLRASLAEVGGTESIKQN
ncbi:ATP-binding protein [Noviherbaspirillum malthae]|jgi:PAS domain S-box-containing protein|uniref:ATP-binding protein n=1 Tax=Noviherbaspirillum malthae TaxID=1260987 RepID=UPI001E43520D|nr:ATP-binding protein [Noviherbaspirillum malthae]